MTARTRTAHWYRGISPIVQKMMIIGGAAIALEGAGAIRGAAVRQLWAMPRENGLRITALEKRVDLLEATARYQTCKDVEHDAGRDGGGCVYFIADKLELFRPPTPEVKP